MLKSTVFVAYISLLSGNIPFLRFACTNRVKRKMKRAASSLAPSAGVL